MARNITEVKQTSSGGGGVTSINPFHQACFASYGHHNNDGGGGFFVYDHNMNGMSFLRGDADGYGSYRTRDHGASEFYDNWNGHDWNRTNNHSGGSADRFDGTNNVGYLGHQYCIQGSGSGAGAQPWIKGWSGANDYTARAFKHCAVICNETHQDYAIYTEHNSYDTLLMITNRDSTLYYHYRHHGHSSYYNIPTQWTDGGQAYGMNGSCCYNKKTKQFVVMERRHNETYRHKPTVWNNIPNLRTIANHNLQWDHANAVEQYNGHSRQSGYVLHNYFSDSNNADNKYVQTDNWPSSGHSESEWRGIPVICDNEKLVWMQMLPHHGFWACRWNADGSFEGRIFNLSWTTSYGQEQGERFGIRWQVTSDGKYVYGYCPSYHYGSGIMGVCVRVSDGKCLYEHQNDSSYGFHLCPRGKSDWFCSRSVNSDGGSGLYHICYDNKERFGRQNDLGHMNSHSSWLTQMIDTAYYSTSYPGIVPMMYNTSLFNDTSGAGLSMDDYDEIHG